MSFHVDFLGALFMIWGVLTMLIGASTLALAVAAAALVDARSRAGGGLAASVTAVTFTVLAVAALAWGLGHVLVGRQLRRRRAWARMLALVLGSLDLLLLPYGTALGIYALWTLLREQAKLLFGATSTVR